MASTQSVDATSINLTRLLSRLEYQLLSPDADPRLRKHSYERTKTGANLEYARSLLLQLEHQASTQTIATRKSVLQTDLAHKRDLIKRLNQRLSELNQLSTDSDISSASASSSDDDEDLFPSYAPAHKNTEAGLEKRESAGDEQLRSAAETLTSTLRSRKQNAGAGGEIDIDLSNATGTGTDLFNSNSHSTDPTAQTETLLRHNRNEQEALTTSLLTLAQQLKSQSVQFGASLEGDKGVLDRAVQGLDKNAVGMEAAGSRMGTLRRMTEGKGWWGRLKLYALIFGLWVAAFLIVFALPKLRF